MTKGGKRDRRKAERIFSGTETLVSGAVTEKASVGEQLNLLQ
jgi:hypothetical protein